MISTEILPIARYGNSEATYHCRAHEVADSKWPQNFHISRLEEVTSISNISKTPLIRPPPLSILGTLPTRGSTFLSCRSRSASEENCHFIPRPNYTEELRLYELGDGLQHVKSARTKNQAHDRKSGQEGHGGNIGDKIFLSTEN